LFKIVTHLQPYAHQGWLEHAKMEEELGNIERCRTLLKRGLKFNPLNENLFLKTLKIEEKEGNYYEVKKLIESLKNNRIEDTYKLLLEGILYEGRSGNTKAAQKALKFLCKRFYGNGKVFLSAAQFEERIGNIKEAIRICEEGLESNYTFGPLWFLLIKLAAKVDPGYQFRYGNNFEELINEAVNCICTTSSDLISKLYMEASQFQETKENIDLARKYLKEAAVSCTNSHKWKVWIVGSRIEARIGSLESAKSLIERSLLEIPQKKQSIGLLEYAKHFELVGNLSSAFKILAYARKSLSGDWKVFFESVLAYIRNGYFEKAEKLVKESLKMHFVTGRLWATLIQLKHAKIKTFEDSKKAYSVFLQANKKIPKSGEVWCEGARLLMSPMSHKYDLQKAEKYLNFAIQFTPQYGDSFLELFKLYTLKGETTKIEELKVTCMHSEPNYGILWFYFKHNINDTALEIWKRATVAISSDIDQLRLIYKAKLSSLNHPLQIKSEFWTGYTALNRLYKAGINNEIFTKEDSPTTLTFEEKWRNIYGFEQIVS
jgi:tetratricopeptide (TPR) repeat protein